MLATLAIALLLGQADGAAVQTDSPLDSRLTPDERIIPGTVAPPEEQRAEPMAADRRAARFFGALGSATLLGDLGAGGFVITPFGSSSINFGGIGGYLSSYLLIPLIPSAASLLPLLAGVAPLPLYAGADGRHLGFGILGATLGTVLGTMLVFATYLFGYNAAAVAPFTMALAGIAPGLGAALAYELSVPEEAPAVPPSVPLRFFSGALASTGIGFALGGSLGAVGALLQINAPVSFFIGAFASPLGFGLGPLLFHPKKSALAYAAAVGGAALGAATMTLAWMGLDIATASMGYGFGFNPLSIVLLAVGRVLSAFIPGLVAAGFYALVADRDDAAPRARNESAVQVMPSIAFDGKRGMLGVTLLLP